MLWLIYLILFYFLYNYLFYISKLINDMKNENYENIICPDWLINLSKKKENKTFIGKKRKRADK